MTVRQRVQSVLNFQLPDDRLPMIEWANWWDKTLNRWKGEGLPADVAYDDTMDYFGLDRLECIRVMTMSDSFPYAKTHGGAVITDTESYNAVKQHLFADEMLMRAVDTAKALKLRHENGEIAIRIWLDGYFWFPRSLFGIENHLFSFYDEPELMHQMNSELTDYNIRVMEAIFEVLSPEFVGIAEDMSYNHGPMLSYDMYKEFLAPY